MTFEETMFDLYIHRGGSPSPYNRHDMKAFYAGLKSRKTTHCLDGQHQYMDRTPRGSVNRNDREQR